MSSIKFRLRGSFLAVLAVGLVWIGCTDNRADLTSPADLGPNILVVDQVALSHAIRVQKAHTDEMFEIAGVVGTGVGLAENGRLVVRVFVQTSEAVAGVPGSREGVTFVPQITGEFFALRVQGQGKGQGKKIPKEPAPDRTSRFDRPVPIGVSTGHPDITAGTIGARVTDGNAVWALSNNHVYAKSNAASIGDDVIQPGTFDGGSSPADDIGTLAAFAPIDFCNPYPSSCTDNTVDAAIALSSTGDLGKATPSDGYGTPKSATTAGVLNTKVKKYGRTTGLTEGNVFAINATVNVNYGGPGVARFVNQIIITPGSFSEGGDSGSLIVAKGQGRNKANDRKPVGLLFAGSSAYTVANPIDAVLAAFGVTIDGQ